MICKQKTCLKDATRKKKSLCETHYYRWYRNGSFEVKLDGHSRHFLYRRYIAMIERCTKTYSQAWDNYGGRGIKVCQRWKDSFSNFLEDVGEPPTKKHSLDRIDNDGDYEPSNVRWALQDVQVHNQRGRSKTGYKGVYKFRDKYRASVLRSGKQYYSGGHLTPEDAHKAYLELENKAYGS